MFYYALTAVDMNTAVVFTVNDRSIPRSSLIALFGNPNDYVLRLANLSANWNHTIGVKYLKSRFYDHFHAVAIDTRSTRVYFGNNALGIVSYLSIYINSTEYQYFLAPPITKQVNFTVTVSLT